MDIENVFAIWQDWTQGGRLDSANQGWELCIPKKMQKRFEKMQRVIEEEEARIRMEVQVAWENAKTCKKCDEPISPYDGTCCCEASLDDWFENATKEEIRQHTCRWCQGFDPAGERDCGCRDDEKEENDLMYMRLMEEIYLPPWERTPWVFELW